MRFAVNLGPKILKFFRRRKIFRSRSREIAPKALPIGGAQPCHEPQRSPSTVPSVGMLRHVRLHAICGESRTDKLRKKLKFFRRRKIFRPKSREIAPKAGRRAHATGCTFPTLIGGAGGPPEGGKLSHVFSDAKNTIFERTFFCAEPVAYLRNPNFSRATRFLVDLPAQGGAVRFFISGFVATALIWPPFWGGRHMILPEACKTGIPELGWLRAIFVRRASN